MREPPCCGSPVSWLRLERYALGELSEDDTREVEARLEACPTCRACADECMQEVEMPELVLPDLPATTTPQLAEETSEPDAAAVPSVAPVVTHPRWRSRLKWVAPASVGLAIAAAALLVIGREPNPSAPEPGIARVSPTEPPPSIGMPDAAAPLPDVRLTVLRERRGRVMEHPTRFLLEDRFALQLSCRPGAASGYQVAVFQSGEWSLPFEVDAMDDVRCGNRVRIPGAFRLSEATPATICVLWGNDAMRVESGVGPLPSPDQVREAQCTEVLPVDPSALD